MNSWPILGISPLVKKFSFSCFSSPVLPMATRANKMDIPAPARDLLQEHLPIDQVDFGLVPNTLMRGLSNPPTSFTSGQGRTLMPCLRPHDVFQDLIHFRPCQSCLDSNRECPGVHPEFFCQDGQMTWLPRTWGSQAYQRRSDKTFREATCRNANCRQLHRPGFHIVNLPHSNTWFSVWTTDPDLNAQTPLYMSSTMKT